MQEFLYVFGFQTPRQRRYGWDDQNSFCFFVRAKTEAEAEDWGDIVAERLVEELYRHSGADQDLIDKVGYAANWIDTDANSIKWARKHGCATLKAGEHPDYATMWREMPGALEG